MHEDSPPPRSILLVTGLSGAGKSSILRILEDLGHEVIDNPPLGMLDEIVARAEKPVAIGVDSRTRGFDATTVLAALSRLRINPHLHAQLIYATAEESVLLRRYTATRRRHPQASHGTVKEGIEAEIRLTSPLREAADVVIDTSDLPPPELRQLVEARFGQWEDGRGEGLTVALMSFAFPAGLPREADMVFDARFLRNPYYDPSLSALTGLDPQVASYVQADPDYAAFLDHIDGLLELVLPRFVQEGKKYATIAVGCSGGRHRSVTLVEALAHRLSGTQTQPPAGKGNNPEDFARGSWPVVVMHRELARQGRSSWRWANRPGDGASAGGSPHGGTQPKVDDNPA
ncbi:RNase adapter RapZ [Gluconacetobacter entanii]|uniref:RNase adapter RapZ n=1 Tax=Gluconacetobacter entanii TaxID=108528 RepID=A0ABT3K2M2_9PROT|nr:RNase adapter RapZ [Gluconacetobacter entanii]MBY4641541.1 RNase adapter RapZ [Gluconacetobacter entanii]MCW4578880.1 RNase adapter RapZ [Gluconacetobacter entanii]MCW4582282.1 RNase adapter RapZ [Gluconacetobacter entanii]MCW4585663.1 RNase adapter RapZ [Gluconacetobacter entanii]MCW4589666.1 RNase adapter RapZ [Gluconacetobacter entanii]